MVLFDLGKTLEDGNVLLPGAVETLEGVAALRIGDRPAVLLGLVSDFVMPTEPSQIPAIQQRYYAILDHLGIRRFFEPVAERVTLSTEVGVRKPDVAVFRAAVAKAAVPTTEPSLTFDDVLFVTENRDHVVAAGRLGMRAVHFRGPGQTSGEVERLTDLIPLVRDFVGGSEEPPDRIVVFRVSPDNAAVVEESATAAGATWARLGDEILVSGRPADVERALIDIPSVAAPVQKTVASERLQLVTQNGRLFQQEHPDVPVIVDKVRYLVVDLDPGEAKKLNVPYMPCYSLQPLPRNTVVLDVRAPVAARRAPLIGVQQCVDALSVTTFEADLQTLTAFPTRHSTSAEFVAAAQWARDQLSASGYHTRTQTVSVSGASSLNVIAERQGSSSAPRDVVLVTAHLDSINIAGGAAAPAPGADDNGSGSAGLLAIARAMKDHPAVHDLRLILFGGEEQGLFGSRRYVTSLPQAERDRIRAVVNMDMIGTLNSPSPTVLLEGAGVSQAVIDGLAEAAATYTTLVVQTSLNPFNSDHVPFIQEGIAAVLTIEGVDGANMNIHSAKDTLQFINYDLALDILRMNVAFVAQALSS